MDVGIPFVEGSKVLTWKNQLYRPSNSKMGTDLTEPSVNYKYISNTYQGAQCSALFLNFPCIGGTSVQVLPFLSNLSVEVLWPFEELLEQLC